MKLTIKRLAAELYQVTDAKNQDSAIIAMIYKVAPTKWHCSVPSAARGFDTTTYTDAKDQLIRLFA